MDKAQFQRELECGAAFAIASRFLRRGLITQDEHRTLTAVLSEKYRPSAISRRQSHPPKEIGRLTQKGGSS